MQIQDRDYDIFKTLLARLGLQFKFFVIELFSRARDHEAVSTTELSIRSKLAMTKFEEDTYAITTNIKCHLIYRLCFPHKWTSTKEQK